MKINNDLYDATIFCEDKQILTHKLIISSCFPVLGNILKLNQIPVIYLRRVKYRNLQNILYYVTGKYCWGRSSLFFYNKTSGYHFPIDDIDSIILSASEGFNQAFSENRKKNIEKPVAVKDAEKSSM